MQITTYTEESLPSSLLAKGEYNIEVLVSENKVSSKGNEMISLVVAIWIDGKIRSRIFDYLLDSIPHKLRHACDTFGLLDKYQSGNIDASDFMGRTGMAKVDIDKDKTGRYQDKNIIRDYCCRPAKSITHDNIKNTEDEDLPF